jgi:hypothetical protein
VYELGSASGGEPTGVGAAVAGRIRIYPNPVGAAQRLTVELPGAPEGGLKISIYSIAGLLVYEENRKAPTGERITISLPAHLAGGVYVLKAQRGSCVYQEKFVVAAREK